MQDLKNIKMFIFSSAEYHLGDGNGDEVLLKIDYKNNKYSLKNKGKIQNANFRREINVVARDLLLRKHGVDFAKKVR